MLSFRDPAAIEALHAFAKMTEDDDLAVAIIKRLDAIAGENLQSMTQNMPRQQAGHKYENFTLKSPTDVILGMQIGQRKREPLKSAWIHMIRGEVFPPLSVYAGGRNQDG